MDWSYVAGYFDGEGHVSMHMTNRGKPTAALIWHNSHRGSLEAIRDFMVAGHIVQRKIRPHQRRPVCVLTVSRRSDLLRVLEAMTPHLIVKRGEAESLMRHVRDSVKDASPHFGRVAKVPTEQLVAWYHNEGKSYGEIGRMLGVHSTAIAQAFCVRGLKARPAGGGFKKGVAMTAETKQRIREAHQRRWQDPAFAARQRAILSGGRAKAIAKSRQHLTPRA